MNSGSQIAMLVYPGSNCDHDCERVFQEKFQIKINRVWHDQSSLPNQTKGLIIPGGFSFGDYLRSGALAALSHIIPSIRSYAAKGGAILGICNGFQILTESKLLPGTLLTNQNNRFICKDAALKACKSHSVWNQSLQQEEITLPIAHKEGRFYIDDHGLEDLKQNDQVLLRYLRTNPNGSTDAIAGICSSNGKIQGMMPHPERASLPGYHKALDGIKVFENFLAHAL